MRCAVFQALCLYYECLYYECFYYECFYYECFYQIKNGEVLIVTLRQKPNRFEQNAWLGLFYYFMQFCCIYTLKCAFQSAGRFIAVRLTTQILF